MIDLYKYSAPSKSLLTLHPGLQIPLIAKKVSHTVSDKIYVIWDLGYDKLLLRLMFATVLSAELRLRNHLVEVVFHRDHFRQRLNHLRGSSLFHQFVNCLSSISLGLPMLFGRVPHNVQCSLQRIVFELGWISHICYSILNIPIHCPLVMKVSLWQFGYQLFHHHSRHILSIHLDFLLVLHEIIPVIVALQ